MIGLFDDRMFTKEAAEIMSRPKHTGFSRPFENLAALLQERSCTLSSVLRAGRKPRHPREQQQDPDPSTERQLFLEAVSDVTPLPPDKKVWKCTPPPADGCFAIATETEENALLQLQNLVQSGKGFIVSQTPEYIEGLGAKVNPETAKRLHRGEFSIQGHIDLHGLTVPDAQMAFDAFLQDAVRRGKRAVLVIHGRGLSSPGKPVLKMKVVEWLTRGHWRKWVMAFTSARLCDGGSGATYVLLRNRPQIKASKKRRC